MASTKNTSGQGYTRFETHYANILSILDSLATQIVENTENPDFWKEDLDLKDILYKAGCPANTFRDNMGYQRLSDKEGIQNAEEMSIDFNPQKYYDLRERNGNL